MAFLEDIVIGIPKNLPVAKELDLDIDHAPIRPVNLTVKEKRLAIENALRYFPKDWHEELAQEFFEELEKYGHIYMYRFRPNYEMYARPIEEYPTKSVSAAAIMHMIQNNLNPEVAQYPHELVTYGGNGSVFQNWIQYRMAMFYLAKMTDEQTLVMYSGHPMGLFPSHINSPRVVVTNGMVIPNYSTQLDYEKMNAIGVSQYGQMTAGSYMYIGPQGIVHGTAITIMNAARKYLKIGENSDLGGILFVTSGLGGMSGAQAKAAVITGAVCVIAECNPFAAHKRHQQGWLSEIYEDLDVLSERIHTAREKKEAVSLGYVGNIVDLLEYFISNDITPHLGSDQTSLHNPWLGGYMPVGMSYDDGLELLSNNPKKFKSKVQESLKRHAKAVNILSENGMFFWDYGNAFLLEASRAGAEIIDNDSFIFPSYVEDIMGPMCFDYGFGPFRWVCLSGKKSDLEITDKIALNVLEELAKKCPEDIKLQYMDNIKWISEADSHNLVVGSKARILYADEIGRTKIAVEFNNAIREGKISGPIVLGRDHHDVSGTDSPYRETANIRDGSMFTADMAVHNFVGDGFRGATWISLHNGGGVGWGEVINGGFGMLIDGSEQSKENIESMISWDVNNGIARRSWARNEGAKFAIKRAMERNSKLEITVSNLVDENILDFLL
ncbi:MAG: urocanate hydratase [Candidatus Thalassarchaeaceae archaeon]